MILCRDHGICNDFSTNVVLWRENGHLWGKPNLPVANYLIWRKGAEETMVSHNHAPVQGPWYIYVLIFSTNLFLCREHGYPRGNPTVSGYQYHLLDGWKWQNWFKPPTRVEWCVSRSTMLRRWEHGMGPDFLCYLPIPTLIARLVLLLYWLSSCVASHWVNCWHFPCCLQLCMQSYICLLACFENILWIAVNSILPCSYHPGKTLGNYLCIFVPPEGNLSYEISCGKLNCFWVMKSDI